MSPLLHMFQVIAHQVASVTLLITPPTAVNTVTISKPLDTTFTVVGPTAVMPSVEPGLYSIVVHSGDMVGEACIKVKPGIDAQYAVHLSPSDPTKALVTGQLIEPTSGEPAGGFIIRSSDGRATTSADDGSFVFVNHRAGEFTFTAQYKDSVYAESKQIIQRGTKKYMVLRLGSSAKEPAVTDGLTAYYPFDDASLNSYGGQQTHGVNFGAQAVIDRKGEAGGALGFDGTNRAQIPDAPWQHTLPMSMSFWMKVDNVTPDNLMILSKYLHPSGEGWSVFIENKRLCVGYFRDGFTTWSRVNIDGEIRDGKWRHYVITVNETRLVLHVDKARIPSSAFQRQFEPTTAKEPIYIGRTASTYPGLTPFIPGFTGAIDELCFYNRVLTDLEIMKMGSQ